jgi:hypothetical protein
VFEGAMGRELDRVIILIRWLEKNVLRREQLVKESFMMGRNTKYKEDRFMIPLESRARSQDQCTSEKSVE